MLGACMGLGEKWTAHSWSLSRSCPLVPALGLLLRLSPTRILCPQVFTGPGWSLLDIQVATRNTLTPEAPVTLTPHLHPRGTQPCCPFASERLPPSEVLLFTCAFAFAYHLFLLLGTKAPERKSPVVSSANPCV